MKPEVLRVYPSELLLEEALSKESESSFVESKLTWQKFLEELYWALPKSPRLLSEIGRELLAARVIAEVGKRMGEHFFSGIQKTATFPHLVLSFIKEAKKALLSPEDFESLSCPDSDKPRLLALAGIFRCYQEALQESSPPLADDDDRELFIAEALEHSYPFPLLCRYCKISFCDLSHLTPLRAKLIYALGKWLEKRGGELELSVVYDPEKPEGVFGFVEEALTRVEAIGSECASLNPPHFLNLNELKRPEPLQRLLLSFAERYPRSSSSSCRSLRDSPQALSNGEEAEASLIFEEAWGKRQEVESCALFLRQELAQGRKPEEMLVVVRDLEEYADLLEEVFSQAAIPYSLKRQSSLLREPLLRQLLSPYWFLENPTSKERLRRLLFSREPCSDELVAATSLLNQVQWVPGNSPEAAMRFWEEAIQGIAEKARLRASASSFSRERERASKEAFAAQKLLSLVKTEFSALENLLQAETLTQHLEALRQLLHSWNFTQKVSEGGTSRGKQVLQKFFDFLEELRSWQFVAPAALSREEFFQQLRLMLERQKTTLPSPWRGVAILRAEDVVGMEREVVCVLGLTAPFFPKSYFEDPLLPDRLKLRMNAQAREKKKGFVFYQRSYLMRRGLYLREAYFFFLTCLAAQKRLALFRHCFDEEGRPLLPSPYFRAAEEIARRPSDSAEVVYALAPPFSHCFTEEAFLTRVALNIASPTLPKEEEAETRSALEFLREERKELIEALFKKADAERERHAFFLGRDTSSAPAPHCGELSSRAAREWLRRFLSRPLSPTALETFGKCPFLFFAKEVVRVPEEESYGLEMDSRTEGTFYHQVLESFLKRKRERGEPLFQPGDEERLRALVEECALSFAATTPTGGAPFLFHLKVAYAQEALSRFWKAVAQKVQGEGRVLESEHSFGNVKLSLLDLTLLFRGKIDALIGFDSGEKLVIDFKASKTTHVLKDCLGKNFERLGKLGWQLPVYSLAAREEFGAGESLTASYWVLKAQKSSELSLELPWNSQVEEKFLEGASETLQKIASGEFFVEPYDVSKVCRHCTYAWLCRNRQALDARSF